MGQGSPIQRVAVVGTGTVGASWTAYFLARGLRVVATDPGPGARDELFQFVERAWPVLTRIGLSEDASIEHLRFVDDLAEALQGAEIVQESAPEREQLKIDLLQRIDAHCAEDVIIASSTSGLLVSRLQSGMSHPERCVIAHPFNPPHLMPLVEVVGGDATDPAVIDRALGFYRSIGKHPIHVQREVVGHVANRLQAAVFREALHLVHEGVVSVADIDAAVLYGPGMRWALMGPFLTFHLAGGKGGIEHFLDHLASPYNDWFADLGNDFITPGDTPMLVKGVNAMVEDRSIAELVEKRDAELVKLLTTIETL